MGSQLFLRLLCLARQQEEQQGYDGHIPFDDYLGGAFDHNEDIVIAITTKKHWLTTTSVC